jgi:hypothetical protein
MAAFFAKLHGIAAPSSVPLVKPRVVLKSTPHSHSGSSVNSSQRIATSGVPNTHDDIPTKRPMVAHGIDRLGPKEPLKATGVGGVSMRRSQSSIPPSKKRKERSRAVLEVPPQFKRRRTESPSYHIHRSSSDDETNFSEPVRLFRGDTPDVVLRPPVERNMLNPHAGEMLEIMHAKELVCVVDKDSFFQETEDKPALEIIVQLPFGPET